MENDKIIFTKADWILYIGALIILALILFTALIDLFAIKLPMLAADLFWMLLCGLVIRSKRKKLKDFKSGKTKEERQKEKESSIQWLP